MFFKTYQIKDRRLAVVMAEEETKPPINGIDESWKKIKRLVVEGN